MTTMTTHCERCGRRTHAHPTHTDVTWCPRDCTQNVLSRKQRRVLTDTILFIGIVAFVTLPVSPWMTRLVWTVWS